MVKLILILFTLNVFAFPILNQNAYGQLKSDEKNSWFFKNIIIKIENDLIFNRVCDLLIQTNNTEIGKKLLDEIASKPENILTIYHSSAHLSQAGGTSRSAFSESRNGTGGPVKLFMDFRVPDSGSHVVYECKGGETSFSFLMNFIHELRHVRDAITGQVIEDHFEYNAVESENKLREELGIDDRRCALHGEYLNRQIWFPND